MGPGDGGRDLLDALRAQPGGAELLALGQGGADLALVGGAVRDLLLGREPRELDVVAGQAAPLAEQLASELVSAGAAEHPTITLHERFGTAILEWDGGRVDIAGRRAEFYSSPGALPEVRPGTAEEDLRRRDFTVNAIAVPLGGSRVGELMGAEHAVEDLAAGRLRVLHERSFIDDPTRLLRLARYGARLGFEFEQSTAALAAEALVGDALNTVSRARIGAELRLALGEPDPVAALDALDELGVLRALEARLSVDRPVMRRALKLLPEDGRPDLLLMASLLIALGESSSGDPEPVMYELLDGLEFKASDRERVMRSALVAPALTEEIVLAELPSGLYEVLSAHTIEAVALGAALAGDASLRAAQQAACEWFRRLRHVRLAITGEDLLANGVPAGPEIGRRLGLALACKLDGELADGREAELQAALEPCA
jgi:tRNA nucleotidyltransferase (CCA-adding enzyme)